MHTLSEWWDNITDDLENDPEYKAEAISIDLAIKISEKMNEKKISQSELAKKLKVSKAYISQVLQGKNNMTLLTICKIGAALGLDPKVLFEDMKKEGIVDNTGKWRSSVWYKLGINE
jgi:transcriptional regulator with XRE-family HTH domain